MLTLTTPSSPASPPRPPEFMDTRPARVGLLLRPRATAELSGSSRSTHRRARSVIAGGYLEERGRPGRGPAAGGERCAPFTTSLLPARWTLPTPAAAGGGRKLAAQPGHGRRSGSRGSAVRLGGVERGRMRAAHPLASALPVIRRLLVDDATDAGVVVAVSAADGTLLWVEGDPKVCRRAEAMNFVPGADWSERGAGTNAPGTALALDSDCRSEARSTFPGLFSRGAAPRCPFTTRKPARSSARSTSPAEPRSPRRRPWPRLGQPSSRSRTSWPCSG